MRYILADMVKARANGINLAGHRTKNGRVALNEKEVLCTPALSSAETFEEKVAILDGTIHTGAEIIDILNRT